MGDVVKVMEQWAPAWLAEDWDRVGLMTGRPGDPAGKVWVALELSRPLLDRALQDGAQMILTHHPPIFQPLDNLRSDNPAAALPLAAAAAGLALFAAHTNLDAAPGGVSDALAQRLGLEQVRPLQPAGQGRLLKLVTFVPPERADQVTRAMFQAGAGVIGGYRECSFATEGLGGFLAPSQSNPFVGRPGQRTTVEELRLETVLPRALTGPVLAALYAAHPYEQPAVDLYPLEQAEPDCGLGRVGELAQEREGLEFIQWAAARLGSGAAQYAGAPPARLKRVAVVGGSGAELTALAGAAGAQMLITGEARHHQAEDAQAAGVCLVTLGHHQSEQVIVEPWAQRLQESLRAMGLASQVRPWLDPQPPWRAVAPAEAGA